MSSGRRKKPIKKSTIVKIIIAVIILAVVIFGGIKVLRKKVDQKMNSGKESTVTSAEVTNGSISTTVTGSGTLGYEDAEDLTIPADAEIEKYYVSSGETVAQGDLLASVNMTSLLTVMSSVQTEIAELDAELADAEDEEVSDEITTSVSGRVKKIFVEKNSDVATVMYENNALVLLSIDGEMTVEVQTDSLSVGDAVDVTTGGKTYDGTVENIISGNAVVSLTDNGPEYGAEATVSKDGSEIGTGTLAISRPLSITGIAGTVSAIKVSENDKVSAGKTLLTLTDTSYTANYDSLLKEREELEEKLENMVKIYKEGAVYASDAGIIVTLTKGSPKQTDSATGYVTSEGTDTVFSIAPDSTMNVSISVDESDILSLSVGQTATITISSLDDQSFTGTVSEIGKEGTSSNGVTTYSCVISIEKNSSMLSGMSADASIMIEGTENALLIPADALNQTQSTAYVYTSYDEENDTLGDMVEVTVGLSNNKYVEITSGLTEGQTVYYNEAQTSNNPFGDMSNFPGGGDFNPSDFGGGNMPSGGFPGGGSDGGSSGSFPSGGFPGGGSSGGPSGGSFPGKN